MARSFGLLTSDEGLIAHIHEIAEVRGQSKTRVIEDLVRDGRRWREATQGEGVSLSDLLRQAGDRMCGGLYGLAELLGCATEDQLRAWQHRLAAPDATDTTLPRALHMALVGLGMSVTLDAVALAIYRAAADQQAVA